MYAMVKLTESLGEVLVPSHWKGNVRCSLHVKCYVETEINQLLPASPMSSQQSASNNGYLQLSCA